ncbi:hypothetical protein M2459_000856 [Parabacteroides sp. PF5-5]|uniref:hypothetical protein n=1 Tax=unclassified Parabacteroides TaxID=2649774 RepID=UPI0024741063|nr:MULTISPECIES: hypothetical protein [unclassified Parabacteroides]MDH6304144.1 hypothetical protein [Parabacteroides sp. PH5-39]MDH6315156.1 hypothetical protein [Parabacteroides sp. PF5-13]MDH6318801.1 hypothetical protein [Parabacteroides sp. PH5-13]MDH6322530.1 hypothetical protein [Parabacteroides sp. PH5-8]MDH6326318.1 hypothetical protein [Parabacteroides sp. PH5-41]
MKKLFFCSMLAVGAMLMSSCLGDGGSNEYTYTYYGVADYSLTTGKTVLHFSDADYPLYSSTLALQLNEGECYYVTATIKSDDNPDVATTGYYNAIPTAFDIINKGQVIPIKSDTAVAKQNEMATTNVELVNYVKGYLFVNSYHEAVGGSQKNEFEFSYDSELPTITSGGNDVYQLYLRVRKVQDGTSVTSNLIIPNAYNVKRFFDNISNVEKAKGKDKYYFRINYIKSFDKDSVPTWTSSEVQYNTIPKES